MKKIKMCLPVIDLAGDKMTDLEKCIRTHYLQLWDWANRSNTDCFRIYDREIKEYPLAIDFYSGRFSVQYFPPTREHAEPSPALVNEIVKVLCGIFKRPPSSIYWRTHTKNKATRQYEKMGESKEFFTAFEYGLKFKINLLDYLDTGLFLDHRETRKMVGDISKGKRLLNLFAYTCSFSIHAAAGGAIFTKSVDLSNTYTNWGRDNFLLNSFSLKNNEVVREDCLKFLDYEIRFGKKYDIIIIDPPTISRSKKMDGIFDVTKDYASLISKALQLLSVNGTLFFSTNSRKFVFDENLFKTCTILEISQQTVPSDFSDTKIHRCWRIEKKVSD
jgi:23S rRNA (cytosine1962-C5)-methyltransferase